MNDNLAHPLSIKEKYMMHSFLKKMYAYSFNQRSNLANYLEKEGEHGLFGIQIEIMRIFYPNQIIGYSWVYTHKIDITLRDIQLNKRMKYAKIYAKMYLTLSPSSQEMIIKKLKKPLIKDKILSKLNCLFKFFKYREYE